MIDKRIYTVPITGQVKDWESLTGDPGDPITAVGVVEYSNSWDGWAGVPGDERQLTVKLKWVDWDVGEALVEVEGNGDFLDALGFHVAGRSCGDVAAECGRLHLKRPGDAPRSALDNSLFNRG